MIISLSGSSSLGKSGESTGGNESGVEWGRPGLGDRDPGEDCRGGEERECDGRGRIRGFWTLLEAPVEEPVLCDIEDDEPERINLPPNCVILFRILLLLRNCENGGIPLSSRDPCAPSSPCGETAISRSSC